MLISKTPTNTLPHQEIVAWYKPVVSSRPSDITARAYANAISFFEKELAHDDHQKAWIRKHASMNDVVKVVDQAKNKYEKALKQNDKARKWIDNFGRTITHYAGVLDVVVQADPAHAGLVWGVMKFVFIGVLNHSQYIAELSKALTKIGEVLPRVQVDAALYDHVRMNEATARLYAYILLFLQKAVKWYTMRPAMRAVSSILNPYSASFQEIVEEIRQCTATVDAVASTSGRAEIRGLTLSLEKSEQKLQAIQSRLNELQASSDRTEIVVMRVLQVALNNHDLTNAIKVDTADSRMRICDIQFSRILEILAPDRHPLDVLQKCRSFSKKGPSWRQPGRDTNILMRQISNWVSTGKSSLCIIQAGPSAELRTKAFVVELIGLIKTTPDPIFWYLSEPGLAKENISPSAILKTLVYQVLQRDSTILQQDPQLGNIRAFEVNHTPAEWINLTSKILLAVKKAYVVIEIPKPGAEIDGKELIALEILDTMHKLFQNISNGRNVVKMVLINYAHQSSVATAARHVTGTWAKIDPPLPASRRSTYRVPLRLRGGLIT